MNPNPNPILPITLTLIEFGTAVYRIADMTPLDSSQLAGSYISVKKNSPTTCSVSITDVKYTGVSYTNYIQRVLITELFIFSLVVLIVKTAILFSSTSVSLSVSKMRINRNYKIERK